MKPASALTTAASWIRFMVAQSVISRSILPRVAWNTNGLSSRFGNPIRPKRGIDGVLRWLIAASSCHIKAPLR